MYISGDSAPTRREIPTHGMEKNHSSRKRGPAGSARIYAVKPKRRRSGIAADGAFGHCDERVRDAPG
jgi:hypothetical protein